MIEHRVFQVSATEDATTSSNINSGQLDPSSEAEALSHVASGIAASLGLAADSPSNVTEPEAASGPLSDLETFEGKVEGNLVLKVLKIFMKFLVMDSSRHA